MTQDEHIGVVSLIQYLLIRHHMDLLLKPEERNSVTFNGQKILLEICELVLPKQLEEASQSAELIPLKELGHLMDSI